MKDERCFPLSYMCTCMNPGMDHSVSVFEKVFLSRYLDHNKSVDKITQDFQLTYSIFWPPPPVLMTRCAEVEGCRTPTSSFGTPLIISVGMLYLSVYFIKNIVI